MKKLIIALLLFSAGMARAQKIEFLEKNDTLQKPKWQQFIFLSENTDVSKSIFVAKAKATGSLKNITPLFELIRSETQNLGANSFRFESFRKLDAENGELILSAYFSEDALFDENFANIPKNKLYIFGSQNLSSDNSQNYKIDGQKQEIKAGEFKAYDLAFGNGTKISKGGITGMTLWITRSENDYSSFLSFSGIGIVGGGVSPGGGAGIVINTGKINRVEPNLALLLMKIYSEKK